MMGRRGRAVHEGKEKGAAEAAPERSKVRNLEADLGRGRQSPRGRETFNGMIGAYVADFHTRGGSANMPRRAHPLNLVLSNLHVF
jgi:hypothetical protein